VQQSTHSQQSPCRRDDRLLHASGESAPLRLLGESSLRARQQRIELASTVEKEQRHPPAGPPPCTVEKEQRHPPPNRAREHGSNDTSPRDPRPATARARRRRGGSSLPCLVCALPLVESGLSQRPRDPALPPRELAVEGATSRARHRAPREPPRWWLEHAGVVVLLGSSLRRRASVSILGSSMVDQWGVHAVYMLVFGIKHRSTRTCT
jgi:hypothetical protein